MTKASNILSWAGAIFISAIFLDSLRFKFTGHPTPEHIFSTLKDWSGIGLFFPAGPWIIGLGEALASLLLILLPVFFLVKKNTVRAHQSQALGALIAIGIMSGAIIFHLFTPLGIETPVEWAGNEPTKFSAALFYSACVSWALGLFIAFHRRDALKDLIK